MIYQPSEAEMGTESGRQQLVLKLHPSGAWNESTDRTLPLLEGLSGPPYSARLHVKDREPFVPGEDLDNAAKSCFSGINC